MRLDDFLSELKKRRVVRVAIAYAVVGWVLAQVAEIAFEAFELPPSAMQVVIIVVVIGFPVALVLSWLFDITPGGIKRAGDSVEDTATRRAQRPLWRMVAGLAVIAALGWIAAAVIRSTMSGPDFGDPRKSIIVFPFENRTSAEENDYLQQASANLLGLAIGQWDDMRVYDDERTGSLLRKRGIESPRDIDFDTAREMARSAVVGTFVLGDLRWEGPPGGALIIEAKVYDTPSGDRLAVETVEAPSGEDPRAAFDRLAASILSVSGAPAGDRPDLVTQTTHSLEAYREYVAGSRALQLLQTDSAELHLERAVAIDSTFALAYLKLAELDGWVGIERNEAQRNAHIAKAVANSANLPPRYRKLVQFHEAFTGDRMQRAREIAREMIEHDSTDVEAWYQLGEAHFHGKPDWIPHADTMGNFGIALRAFEKTLALDSAYVLAYFHIIDALNSCRWTNPWLCMADSAVYASNDELVERYGQGVVDSIRAAADEERMNAAYGWTVAAPASDRARSTLTDLLLDAGRLDEVREQVAVFEAQGKVTTALGWESRLALEEQEYGQAAASMADAINYDPSQLRSLVSNLNPDQILFTLAGGARVAEAIGFMRMVLPSIPGDTITGAGDFPYHKDDLAALLELELLGRVGGGEVTAALAKAWLDILDAGYGPGSEDHRLRWEDGSSTILAAYLTSRDTVLLGRFLAQIDTTSSRTWRVMEGHLALERGDSIAARARVDAHFRNRDEVELRGDPGAVRLFGWADLLARLGELEAATEAFALFDTDVRELNSAPLNVRSWAERGALYEELGDQERAIEMYARFVRNWSEGDELVQPSVQEARNRLTELRGE